MSSNFKHHIPDFNAITSEFVADALVIAEKEVKAYATTEKNGFVNRLRDQKFQAFGAIPLRPSTLAQKRRYRRSLKTMICTGTYIASIKVHENSRNAMVKKVDKQFVIGIDPAVRAIDVTGKVRRKVSLNDVARWNEFGAPRRLKNHPPSRPHWDPYLFEMMPRAAKVRREIARLATAKFHANMARRRKTP